MIQKIKDNSKLICITGFMGSGKTSAINFFKENGFETFKMDEYIHSIYKKDELGYKLIKDNFGDYFVNSIEVDREKLRNKITLDKDEKIKLDKLMLNVMVNKVKELYLLNKVIIIELGIYIYNQYQFNYLFKKVISIVSNRNNINDKFNKFHDGYKFSTKPVENYKILENTTTIYSDYIVENNMDLSYFNESLKKFLKTFS